MKIAIVNDSVVAIEAISRVIAGAHQIAWVASDGREAVERCAKDRPDLILMDLIMPELDGIEATRRIMAATPCAIMIVTATVDARAGKVFEALGAGALDAVKTPIVGMDGAAGGAAALLSKIDTIRRLVGVRNEPVRGPSQLSHDARGTNRLVVFGASAGGPAALAAILGELPRDFPAAIVIIQHVDEAFAPLMADWLNDQSHVPVQIAVEGDRPQIGVAMMAAKNDHLVLTNSCALRYTSMPQSGSYRPSVDVFFESVVAHWNGDVIGVLLTGMGRDGASGLKKLRDAGALTIAQDQATSIVYGMPKAAAEMGAVCEVQPLGGIATRLSTLCAM